MKKRVIYLEGLIRKLDSKPGQNDVSAQTDHLEANRGVTLDYLSKECSETYADWNKVKQDESKKAASPKNAEVNDRPLANYAYDNNAFC